MATLYRAYRPQNFKEIVNQNHIKITLQHEIENDRLAHAYLFCGPRGIGKTTVARIFAKAINCTTRQSGAYEPCGTCELCQEITNGRSLDIIEIDAASHTGVDNVRENIISVARVAPTKAKYKVFIIDEVHMLSTQAFNALLKLIEEPPRDTLFILCTTEVHKVPETIISRTERYDFKKISVKDVVHKLRYIVTEEGIKIDDAILENIARQSGGHMRDAESLLGQVVSVGGKEVSAAEADLVIPRSDIAEVLNLVEALAKKDAGTAIEVLNRALDDGIELKRFLREVLDILRKIMLMKLSQGLGERLGLELGESMDLRASEISQKLDNRQVIRMIERMLAARTGMRGSFIEHLPIEVAIIELCLPEQEQRPIREDLPAKATQAISGIFQRPASAQAPVIKTAPSASESVSQPAPTPVPSSPSLPPVANLGKEEIFSRWNEVLARVKDHNHSLSFILRACQPTDINGNQLCLSFKYKFHKERINEINIRQVVEKVLHEVYGHNITIEAVVDEEMKVDNLPIASQEKTESSSTAPAPVSETSTPTVSPPAPANGKPNSDEDMLNNVLKAFGGKVM